MADLDWLIARPVAHRGLHDQKSVIENTPAAFAAAIAGRYGIECDLQVSADGEAMVYHDDALGRLAEGSGRLDATTAAELKRVAFKATADRMVAEKQRWGVVAAAPKRAITTLAQGLSARPQFIAYAVRDLPALLPTIARDVFRLPLLAWTVRSADDRRKAARYADQMIFEGFRP